MLVLAESAAQTFAIRTHGQKGIVQCAPELIPEIAVFATIFVAISCYMVARPEGWWTLPWKMPVSMVLTSSSCFVPVRSPSGKHGVVSCAFWHLLSTRWRSAFTDHRRHSPSKSCVDSKEFLSNTCLSKRIACVN